MARDFIEQNTFMRLCLCLSVCSLICWDSAIKSLCLPRSASRSHEWVIDDPFDGRSRNHNDLIAESEQSAFNRKNFVNRLIEQNVD